MKVKNTRYSAWIFNSLGVPSKKIIRIFGDNVQKRGREVSLNHIYKGESTQDFCGIKDLVYPNSPLDILDIKDGKW